LIKLILYTFCFHKSLITHSTFDLNNNQLGGGGGLLKEVKMAKEDEALKGEDEKYFKTS
jgi:hypothetical protein